MDEESVFYSFTGDVSSLRQATQAAIGLLDKYETKMESLGRLTGFRNIAGAVNAVTADIKRALQSLDKVPKHVENAKSAIDRVEEATRRVSNAADSVASIFTASFNNVRSMVDSVTVRLQSMQTKAATTLGKITSLASSVASAFRRVQQSEDAAGDAASGTEKKHGALSSVLDKLRNLFSKETEAVKSEEEELNKKNKTLKDAEKRHTKLSEVLSRVGTTFSKESGRVKTLGTSFKSLFSASGLLKNALGALSSVGLGTGKWMADSINRSIQYVENLNLFKVALGKSTEAGLKFVDSMAELYGMDPSNLYRYTGYFYQLTDAIGMADEASSTLSLSLTKAANDIASLFNTDIETVVNNLASGMQGIARAVRKYGIDIRAVTLQQTALNYGITASVDTMSEADRQALRYLTMMEQVRNATQQVVNPTVQASGVMGDFARNIETPANQLRVFKEQISQLGRAIGNFFIPILSKLLPIVNGMIMALRTVLSLLASLVGFSLDFGGTTTGAADQAEAIGGIGDAAGGASKALKDLKKTLAPFDEINLLNAPNENTGGGGGGGGADTGVINPALEDAIKRMALSLEDIEMKANKVRDALLKFFGFDYVEVFNPDTGEFEKKLQWFAEKFEANLIEKFPQWEKTISALFENWSSIIEGFKSVFRSIGEVIDAIKTKITEFIASLHLDDAFSSAIAELPEKLSGLSDWISEHKDQIASFVLILGQLFGAFRVFKGIQTFLKPLITLGTTLAPTISSLASFLAPIAAIAATIALLYTNSENFASSFKNLFQTIVDSLGPMIESFVGFIERIWASIKNLWTENLQPMVASIGDAIAPILDTLSVLWETISELFQGFMDLLGTLWETTISPILGAIANIITSLMGIIQKLWKQVIGPVLEHILKKLPELFNTVIKPIAENIGAIIAGLVEAISGILTNVLIPLVGWLIDTLGPSIRNVLSTVWNIVSAIVSSIMGVINGLLLAIRGVIDFVAGVFTGDWERAWNGIKEIFAGIATAIAGVFVTAVNAIISVVNGLISIVWSSVQAFVNGLLTTINSLASVLGFSINLQWGTPPPAIGYLSVPQIALAEGGVVTSPTNALIGEGRYDEAVIPLGNSPQMNEFADSVASKSKGAEQVALLREQNQILKQLLTQSENTIGLQDLTGIVTRLQRQNARAGG